ncbi:MAG: hypothetical protein IH944_11685 [Armatimonadetes bacterium]|nr:hypothetical protein [Armatimonadota bacterium]
MSVPDLLLVPLLLFGGSAMIAYFVTAHFAARRYDVDIEPNSRVRMVGPGGVYRCHFVRKHSSGLVFSSPLQADRFTRIEVGDRLLVQAPSDGYLMTFRSVVSSCDEATKELTLELPQHLRRVDRRSEPRDESFGGRTALLNGNEVSMLDLSAGGACLATDKYIRPGTTVKLELPDGGEAYGWSLNSREESGNAYLGYRTRLRFDEPLSGLDL